MVAELKDTLPDEVREMVVDLRCFEHPNHTGESLMQKAADLIERLSTERDSYKAMIAAGEVK